MEQWVQNFWSELDHLGENEVRLRLVNKTFSGVGKEEIAREWLQQRELARGVELEFRRSQREAAQREEVTRASKAAERAAEAVEQSARRASIAIMIAVTAAIISVLSLLAHLLK
jgi:hypothetical protein